MTIYSKCRLAKHDLEFVLINLLWRAILDGNFKFQSSSFLQTHTHTLKQPYSPTKRRMQVRSALETFQENLVGPCYFFMCFFANNQYRILVEESSSGSDNLEEVFESNLKRIGKMVAILDTWDQPTYLTRVWTVYEQFVASTLQIEATD